ncbi:glycosyltransferase family 2 protein [Azospirillum largimobile]
MDLNNSRTQRALASLEDAINAYRLFLGRHPRDLGELTMATEGAILDLVVSLLTEREFAINVLNRMEQGQTTPHTLFGVEMDVGLQRWALERLPLSTATRDRLATSRSWRFWLPRLLLDEEFTAALPEQVRLLLKGASLLTQERVAAVTEVRQLSGEIRYAGAGRLTGWCANLNDPSETVILEIFLGNRFVGAARSDAAVPGLDKHIGGTDRHGLAFLIPTIHRDLVSHGAMLRVRDAQSKQQVAPDLYIRDNLPADLDSLVRLSAQVAQLRAALERVERQLPSLLSDLSPPVEAYEQFRRLHADHSQSQPSMPNLEPINILLTNPVMEPAELRRMLDGLTRQHLTDWTLVLVEEDAVARSDERATVLAPLREAGRLVCTTSQSLAEALLANPRLRNASIQILIGATVDLEPGAIRRLALAAGDGVAYADHDVRQQLHDGREGALVPVFKPDIDPLMALAYDIAGPVYAIATAALLKVLASDPTASLTGQALLLSLIDTVGAKDFTHLAEVLYTVRQPAALTTAALVPRILSGEPAAVERWAARNGLLLTVRNTLVTSAGRDDEPLLFEPCMVEARVATPPPASVIVPTRNSPALLRGCLDSLLRVRAHYGAPMQILVIDHENEDSDSVALLQNMRARHGVVVLPFRGPFNWAVMNDLAVRSATGEILAFLNDDTVALERDWLGRAAGTLTLPEVGAVGGRLLYADGRVQHAGVVVSPEQGPVHEGVGLPAEDGGYLGRNRVLRSAAAVTGACLVTRRPVYEAVGGLGGELPTNWSDIGFCLSVRRTGLRIAYDPEVCLYHFESKTRDPMAGEESLAMTRSVVAQMAEHWPDLLDPTSFVNPHFSRHAAPFTRLALSGGVR